MLTPPRKLRFAVLCEADQVPAWAAECLRRLLASGYAELVLMVRARSSAKGADNGHAVDAGNRLHRWYVEHWLERRSRALHKCSLNAELPAVEVLDCVLEGPGRCLQEQDLRALRERELDFVLLLAALPVGGEVRDVPRFGIWSYRHDRSTAPCFWEVLKGARTTSASLERLGRGGDPSVELCRGSFGTCGASWVNNVDRVLGGSSDFCVRACAELSGQFGASSAAESAREPVLEDAALTRTPTDGEMLRFLLQTGSQMLRKLWELTFHVEVWNVGFTRQSVAEILKSAKVDASGVTWCKPHEPGHFIADPFAYQLDGVEQVLVEDYPQGGRGRISKLLESTSRPQVALQVDLEEPHHLSYPFIFTEDGETYCVPEAYQSRGVGLYKRTNGTWRLERTLIDGQPIVDPTLFKHQGLYWILCTLQNDGAWGNLKLYGYYAERLDGEWKPHRLNPVKCDIGSSRPAGTPVWVDGELYRPSQDCSETYGGAVVINRIARLSPSEFEEVEAARIRPLSGGPYPDGLHTINPTARGAVIDSKKFLFDPFAWRKNWDRRHEVFR
jgi:hypothetical protein